MGNVQTGVKVMLKIKKVGVVFQIFTTVET